MNTESRKKALRYFFEKIVAPMGFKFTPDAELADFLLEQEVILETKHGIPFCPCQPLHHDRSRDMKIVCPSKPAVRALGVSGSALTAVQFSPFRVYNSLDTAA